MAIKDQDIWESYAQKVKRVAKKKSAPGNDVKKSALKTRPELRLEISAPRLTAARTLLQEENLSSAILERKREKNMRQGHIEIDVKIDLHGMTQDRAFDALARFIAREVKSGKRHLLIVTGKGKDGQGVLRRNLKNWLTQLPEAKSILALRPAAPQHGGDGAFYIVLRKKSPSPCGRG